MSQNDGLIHTHDTLFVVYLAVMTLVLGIIGVNMA